MTAQSSPQNPFPYLPEGTVTFLFTDIEGSTKLLHRLRERYATLLADQRRILREAFANWNGHEVDTQGDAFFVAFSRATQAVGAAAEAQRKLAGHAWPEHVAVRVRMGIHTGEPWSGEEGYVGMDVHRAARIAHVGHGGQVLLSETTTALVRDELPAGVSLFDLGRHLLKDIRRPERICQLVIEGLPAEFPPLTSLEALPSEATRLPRTVGSCPYRGLSAFQEMDAPFYFGRETFISTLEHAIQTRQLVVVIVGSSGSGKSSVLFAGLLPRLRKAGGCQFATFRPGSSPFYSLASALLPLLESGLSETDHLAETRNLAERLAKGEVSLSQVTGRILEKAPETRQILLVADQFEELYTLCADVKLQTAFIDALLATVQEAGTRKDASVVMLLTLRADFMGQALAHRPFADTLQQASLLMGPMTRQELHTAIEKPAEMQGAAFEPGLVERILDDVGEKPGNLPLLEFTLTMLWEQQTDGWLTHSNYEAMGGVEGALATYADQVYAGLDPEDQAIARRALVQLVQPGEGTEDTRRIATRQELGDACWSLIQRLADRRLVVTGRDAAGNETAEVVHEALIQKWGHFQEWMDADRAFRAWQERLRGNLRQWQESSQDEGALLAGAPLELAQNWLVERPDELSESEQQFIQRGAALREQRAAEQEAQQQRELEAAHRLAESEGQRAEEQAKAAGRLRRRAQLLTGASIVAVILAVTAFLAFRTATQNATTARNAEAQAEQQLQLATSRELAAAAVANLHIDTERSVLLALEALNRADTLEARNALHQALPELRMMYSSIPESMPIYGVAFSPDGSRLATAGYDSNAKIWDASTHQLLLTLKTDGEVQDADWSPDGTRLATSGTTNVNIWDTTTGRKVSTLPGTSIGHTTGTFLGVGRVDFSPDGTRLAVANQDGTPKVWDLATGKTIMKLPGNSEICWAIAYSPDGKLLATGSADGKVKVWDAESGEEIHSLTGQSSYVYGVDFSPDSSHLVAVGEAGFLTIWDVASGKISLSLANPSAGGFQSALFLRDGSAVVTTGYDGVVRVWDAVTGQQSFLLAGHTGTVLDAATSPDGRILASGGVDGTWKTWNLGPGREVLTLEVQPGGAGKVAFSPDGHNLAAAATDGKVRVWDSSTGKLVTELTTNPTHPWNGGMAYTRDGKYLAAGALDGVWALWELASERVLATAAAHTNMIQGLAISPDGKYLASSSFDGTVKVWDISNPSKPGEPPRELLTFTKHIRPGTTANWVQDVAISPNGQLAASAGGDVQVRVWDLLSGQEKLTLPGGDGAGNMTGVAFSPDGKWIAGGQFNGVIDVWELTTGKLVLTLIGHSSGVFDLDFNAKGTLLASASFDLLAKIWDMQSGQELASLYGNTGRVMGVAFNPDGTQVATGGEDGSVRLYDVKVDDLVSLARARLTRSLTTDECQKYLHADTCPPSP